MAGKFVGRTTGMGVTQYQDWTFATNDDRRLTDQQISDDWHREFPEAKHNSANDVRDIRRRYNIGSQGHGPAKIWSYPYDEQGRRYMYPNGSSKKPAHITTPDATR